jgi:hypothetical protein
MPVGSEKKDQPYRDQPDEGVAPHHREIERGHTTLLSGEIVTYVKSSRDRVASGERHDNEAGIRSSENFRNGPNSSSLKHSQYVLLPIA